MTILAVILTFLAGLFCGVVLGICWLRLEIRSVVESRNETMAKAARELTLARAIHAESAAALAAVRQETGVECKLLN